jgi:hypothetical protein
LLNLDFDNYIVLTHDNCLLDKSFLHKYTHDTSAGHEDSFEDLDEAFKEDAGEFGIFLSNY